MDFSKKFCNEGFLVDQSWSFNVYERVKNNFLVTHRSDSLTFELDLTCPCQLLVSYSNVLDKFKKVISVSQRGFIKGRSTSTKLNEFVNEAILLIESGGQLDTDVRKAFDSVSRSLFIQRLKELGVY